MMGVDEIARSAGVGVGTLYRRFPTKADLLRTILESRVAELCEVAEEAERNDDPWTALEIVLDAALRLQERVRGMVQLAVQSLGPVALPDNVANFHGRLAALLRRAQRAGQARTDIGPGDLPVLLKMAASATMPALTGPDLSSEWPRFLALLLDGLRAR